MADLNARGGWHVTAQDEASSASSKDERIKALEGALERSINYLRALPLHPQTYREANQADAVLKDILVTPPGATFVAKAFTPAGVPLFVAQVEGNVLRVKGGDISGLSAPTRKRIVHELFEYLGKGVTVPLREVSSGAGSAIDTYSGPANEGKPGDDETPYSHFMAALTSFTASVGLDRLIIKSSDGFIIDLPDDCDIQGFASDRLKHLSWWFVASLSGQFNGRCAAPACSSRWQELAATGPENLGELIEERVGAAGENWMMDLLTMAMAPEHESEGGALLDFLEAYRMLSLTRLDTARSYYDLLSR